MRPLITISYGLMSMLFMLVVIPTFAQKISKSDSIQTDTAQTEKKSFFKRLFQKKQADTTATGERLQLETVFAQAQELYRDGLPDSVLTLLSKNNLQKLNIRQANPLQKAEIYRLRALASVLTDDMRQVQQNVKRMLTYEPDYREREDDLADFKWHKARMTVLPKMVFGVKAGTTVTMPQTIQRFSLFERQDDILYNVRSYSSNLIKNSGFAVGLQGEYTLFPFLRIGSEVNYSNYRFTYTSNAVAGKFSRTLNYGEIIVNGKYVLPTHIFAPQFTGKKLQRWNFYVMGGGFYRPLLSSHELETLSNTDLEITPWLASATSGFLWGGGIRRVNKKSWFTLEVVQKVSTDNIVNPNHRFYNSEGARYLYDFYDVSDDMSLNHWEISLGMGFYFNYKVFAKRFKTKKTRLK